MISKVHVPNEISVLLNKIEKETKPVSVFIYGSRVRSDYLKHSDYEIGVLFRKDKKWEREKLANFHSHPHVSLFPFIIEDLQEYKIDTPFPKNVYLRELIESARTVREEKIIEKMDPPQI
ncbi:nucleotidyltransferase domain-containing protein [Patescibacteria group bacterium]|nr:nucleotidyltransferase domain-containing protein [Patescibacteria group bacterium]